MQRTYVYVGLPTYDASLLFGPLVQFASWDKLSE